MVRGDSAVGVWVHLENACAWRLNGITLIFQTSYCMCLKRGHAQEVAGSLPMTHTLDCGQDDALETIEKVPALTGQSAGQLRWLSHEVRSMVTHPWKPCTFGKYQ